MSNINIFYPIIVFKKNNSMIFVHKRKFFTTTADLIKFYTNINVIDSEGKEYSILKAEIEKSKGFNLLYLEKLFQVKPVLKKPPSKITLDDLKIKIMNQVKLKPKFWSYLDSTEGIQEMVNKVKNYKELILIFK